jgi:hypothetical protein
MPPPETEEERRRRLQEELRKSWRESFRRDLEQRASQSELQQVVDSELGTPLVPITIGGDPVTTSPQVTAPAAPRETTPHETEEERRRRLQEELRKSWRESFGKDLISRGLAPRPDRRPFGLFRSPYQGPTIFDALAAAGQIVGPHVVTPIANIVQRRFGLSDSPGEFARTDPVTGKILGQIASGEVNPLEGIHRISERFEQRPLGEQLALGIADPINLIPPVALTRAARLGRSGLTAARAAIPDLLTRLLGQEAAPPIKTPAATWAGPAAQLEKGNWRPIAGRANIPAGLTAARAALGIPPRSPSKPIGPATAETMAHISFKETKERVGDRFRRGWHGLRIHVFDDLHPISRFVEAAKKGGAALSSFENPYLWARLLRGVGGKANAFIDEGTFGKKFWRMEGEGTVPDFRGPGLREIMEPVKEGKSFELFSTYLQNRRAVRLADRRLETGINPDSALKSVGELERAFPEFPQIAQRIYKYQDDLLQYGAESGLFSPDMIARLRQNTDYIPFHRVMDALETKGFMGQKLANIASPIKRMVGSKKPIISPLESLIKNTHSIIEAADRNQVGVMMARIVNDYPELQALFRPIRTPTSKVATVTAKELGFDTTGLDPADADRLVDVFRPVAYAKNANEVTVLINGKKHFFAVDPDLYRGLLALDKQDIGILHKFFGPPARWLRAGAILSPDFLFKNPLRDQLSAFIYSRYGFIPGVDWMKGMSQSLGASDELRLYRMSGAEMANLVSVDRTMSGRTIEEIAKSHGFTKYVKNPIELLRIASEFAERGSRLSEFSRGVRGGADPLTAAFSAREVTQDFAMMGTTARALNQIIPFFGANVGSWSRLAREARENPLKASTKAFLGITLPSMLLYSVNRNDPRWAETPQWQKDAFWIIPTPEGVPRPRIPKPFMLGHVFGSLPERFLEYLDKKDPELLQEWSRNAASQGTPGILPQAILPHIENISNHSFFLDRPIVPRAVEDAPVEFQYSGQTSEAAKALGKWVNYSPAKIDNIFRGYTGTLGRYVTDTIDPILKNTGITYNIPDPSMEISDMPVLRSFFARDPYGSGSVSVDKLYRELEKFEGMEKLFRVHLERGGMQAGNRYRDENPEAAIFYDYRFKQWYSRSARSLRLVGGMLAELRRSQREYFNSPTVSPEKKRSKINEINRNITATAAKALRELPKP